MNQKRNISTIGKNFKKMNADTNAERKKRSTITIAVATVIIIAVNLFVVWWWPHTSQFGKSGVFKEDDVQKKTERVIELLEQDDYEELSAMSNETMQTILAKENRSQWDTAKNNIGKDWGEFVSFGKANMAELKQRGKLYTTVQIDVSYQHVIVSYSMSFDEDMKLAGLYLQSV